LEERSVKMILDEIRTACRMRLYYLAIMLCLALPDICAALQSSDGTTSEKNYRMWVHQWFPKKYGKYLTPQDLYRLRCDVLHQGRMGHPGLRFGRVAFAVKGLFHLNLLPSTRKPEILNLSAGLFCKDMVESVEAWETAMKEDITVHKNLSRLVHLHPNGLEPYLQGVPCVS
jgi:hypothetical protein